MDTSTLQFVDLVGSDGEPAPGLIPVSNPDMASLSIDERASVSYAESFEEIDFVFFRRFSDGRSSQIAAYVVDNCDERLDESELAKLHLQVWLHGTAPLVYVGWPSRIDVLTCARGPDFWKVEGQECQYNPAKSFELEALTTAGAITSELEECSQFSVLRLADGTFWDDPSHSDLADHTKAAHQSLIQAIVEADIDLKGNENPLLRRLLLLMVLIKYLEDRRVFPTDGWFGKFHKGARSFFEVLQGGDPKGVYQLLGFLERKFNGDIFVLPNTGQKGLTKEILKRFADLVEAKTLNRQRYLWDQFSFRHLPVEIISHLYQRFVQGGQGAVYTPPFLASLLLDHAMPYEKLDGDERVLDPACGSGVFLVGAYRRLVNFWRSRNGWQRPDVDTLKRILSQSIYGIELDPNAIDLTAFSLCLAVCDALQPDVIWRDLKFDPLRRSTLFEKDFFRVLLDSKQGISTALEERFDIVIGNPPFESNLSPAGTEVDRIAKKQRGSLPDKQAAYLFLEQALTVLRPDGRVCLIQPSQLLYNQKTQGFRAGIQRKNRFHTILDFTSIRNLYEADSKTIAILAEDNPPPKNNLINHWTFRRTVSVHERICFELDHYDRHRVSQRQAESYPYIWRTNLLGGGRLFDISQRLRSMRTLEEYVREKGWDYGEGFIVGDEGKRTPAPFLTGKPLLPTAALTDEGIDETKIKTVEETRFRSAYTKDRFSAPLVLIKQKDSLPIVYRDRGFLAYGHQIVGIHAPVSEASELQKMYKALKSRLDFYRFVVTIHGSRSLVARSTSILKRDIDLLPFPEEFQSFEMSFWEKAIQSDVLSYLAEFIRRGQNSDLLSKKAEAKDLQAYSSMFIRMLSSVYDNLRASTPVFLSGLTCQPFYFGERPNLSWLTEQPEKELHKIIYHQNHSHLRTVRMLRFYSENVLLLIKPDRLRYWIHSTAIRDADETLVDLRRQGY